MKQLEVHIMQQSYLLSCPEGQESRLLEAVERVDTAMTRIRDAGKVRARERIAVLAALNLAFEVVDREQQPPAAAAAPALAPTADSDVQGDDLAFARALAQRLDEALGSSGQLF